MAPQGGEGTPWDSAATKATAQRCGWQLPPGGGSQEMGPHTLPLPGHPHFPPRWAVEQRRGGKGKLRHGGSRSRWQRGGLRVSPRRRVVPRGWQRGCCALTLPAAGDKMPSVAPSPVPTTSIPGPPSTKPRSRGSPQAAALGCWDPQTHAGIAGTLPHQVTPPGAPPEPERGRWFLGGSGEGPRGRGGSPAGPESAAAAPGGKRCRDGAGMSKGGRRLAFIT